MHTNKEVINLSTHFRPTRQQGTLLGKGLSFIATRTASRTTRQEIAMDLYKYHRCLKLHSVFGPQPPRTVKTFTGPSAWEPHISQLPSPLLDLIREDGTALSNLKHTLEVPNLTLGEEQALKELIKNREIVIKPADKGRAIVLIDLADYVTEALRQLRDTQYYIQYIETNIRRNCRNDQQNWKHYINQK